MSRREHRSGGPFRSDQLRSGDPYELSNGHPVYCAPTGQDGAGPNGFGFAVLDSDPAVESSGVDAGLALSGNTLRAPDVAIGIEKGEGTWAKSAALAVEYAGRGQDEAELRAKIRELLDAGTKWVWVVRLVGPARVEVHERDRPVRIANHDDTLTAPGVLKNAIHVRALFDRDAAHEATLRNLLERQGYTRLSDVRDEGREEGRSDGRVRALREALVVVIESRGWSPEPELLDRIAREANPATLMQWTAEAARASSLERLRSAIAS